MYVILLHLYVCAHGDGYTKIRVWWTW